MAEGGDSKFVFDMADWTDKQDSHSHQKRSDIVRAIINDERTNELSTILETGWDVNEILCTAQATLPYKFVDRNGVQPTTLHESSRRGWTEGVKMLFDAGAKYRTLDGWETPLMMALYNRKCPSDLIDLLLKHGADPNPSEKMFEDLPLVRAIWSIGYNMHCADIVKLLLTNGADPNVSGDEEHETPLSECLNLIDIYIHNRNDSVVYQEAYVACVVNKIKVEHAAIFQTLLDYGANFNWNMNGTQPLLHKFVAVKVAMQAVPQQYNRISIYLPEHLDIFYKTGYDINMEYYDQGTALDYAVREGCHSNSVRWLIRHGADMQSSMSMLLENHFILYGSTHWSSQQQFEETPLILLQAGMRVSHEAHLQLDNIEREISSWQSKPIAQRFQKKILHDRVMGFWGSLRNEAKGNLQSHANEFRKCTPSDYLTMQMTSLNEFSDDLMQHYPSIPHEFHSIDESEFVLNQIHKVLKFLSQPQSLQWYCRRCVRENLVSLHPSVVKKLPVPARLKRYILCHEI